MLFDGLIQQVAERDERDYWANPIDVSDVALPPGFAGAADAFLIFHGRGGPDRETDDLLARVLVRLAQHCKLVETAVDPMDRALIPVVRISCCRTKTIHFNTPAGPRQGGWVRSRGGGLRLAAVVL